MCEDYILLVTCAADHPGRPGRPHVTKVAATEVFLIWDEPEHDGNSPIASYRIDHRKRGQSRGLSVPSSYIMKMLTC